MRSAGLLSSSSLREFHRLFQRAAWRHASKDAFPLPALPWHKSHKAIEEAEKQRQQQKQKNRP